MGSGLLEPGLLHKLTWKSTDPVLLGCRLSPDVAPLDCKYFFFSTAISSSLIFVLGGFSGLADFY